MHRNTGFLKVVLVLMALFVAALCLIVLPALAKEVSSYYPPYFLYPTIVGMYACALPYFYSLFQGWQLLVLIDRQEAFSSASVTALRRIKYSAGIIALFYLACLPFFALVGQVDDAPGLILVGLIFTFAPLVVSVFAAVLEKLLEQALAIKAENDLTV